MKHLFLVILLILAAASAITAWRMPEAQSEVPVLYWITDPNPARDRQIETFHNWLEKHGHPRMELRVDAANSDISKMVIQGVSGMGGDIMDLRWGGLRYFHALGLLEDVTEDARRMGFDPGQTYPAMEPEITLDGRQYLFPCNVYARLYWVNVDTFARYGLPPPPREWDFDTFERIGKQFVAAANQPGQRHRVFFANDVNLDVLRRSMGLATFNETLSACILDDPRYVELLDRVYKWTYEDRLLPSAADRAAFALEATGWAATMQLFHRGNYAMFRIGRYGLISFRQFGEMNLSVSHQPYGHFPNTETGTRAAAVYIGGRHKELAKYFLAYLASEDYNRLIVDDADALPPNPLYTQTEEFLRPAKYPNEWGLHEVFAEAAQTIAIAADHSPFVLPDVVQREQNVAVDMFMTGRITAKETARLTADRINAEIQRQLHEQPSLRPSYEEALTRQAEIDRRRAAGEKVPLEWIDNPFYRRYYEAMGWGA